MDLNLRERYMIDVCLLRHYTAFNSRMVQLSHLYIAIILFKMIKRQRILLDASSASSLTVSQRTIPSSRSSCSEDRTINYWTLLPASTILNVSAHRVSSKMSGLVRTDWTNFARSIDLVSFMLGHPFFVSPMSIFSALGGTTVVSRARSRAALRHSVRSSTWRSLER
jgi:hypothetical protein